MTAREILVAARALLERGWTQWVYNEWRGGVMCYCLTGAVYMTGRDHPLEDAFRLLESEVPGRYHTLVQWNDTPGRTQQDVLDLLDRAIARTA